MTTDRTTAGFWDFSLAFYALPGVAEDCLELQDRGGLDVNVLLYLLHVARHGRRLGADDVARIEALTAPWREAVVVPLRGVRRVLKGRIGVFEPQASARLRSEVKRIELAAERQQQETLEQLAAPQSLGTPCDDALACARTHLELYGRGLDRSLAETTERILARFAAFSAQGARQVNGHGARGAPS